MPPFGQINKAIAYLRSEIPSEDVSKNPIVQHPHNTTRAIPERLPAATIKELSALEPAKAIAATAEEWAAIISAIALCSFFWHPALYLIAVVVIGSRQHALLILGHDASHYRYLPTRWQNDLVANVFLMWPTFASVEGFRKFHSTHHQYTNLPNDGNRHIWYTHDAMGELEPGWRFPKTRLGLALVLLRRAFFVTGMFWIVRGLVGASLIPSPHWMIAAKIVVLFLDRRRPDLLRGLAGLPALLARAVLHLAYRGSICPHHLRAQRRRERRGGVCDHPDHRPDLHRVASHPAAECRLPSRAPLVSERALLPPAGSAPSLDGARGLSHECRGQALGDHIVGRMR